MSEPALRVVPDVDPDTGEIIENAACQECARLRGLLFTLEQDNRRLEKDLRTWRGKYEKAIEDRDAKLRNDKDYPAAADLFEEWQRECGHPDAQFDHARVGLAIRAIRRYRKHRDKLSLVIQYGRHLAYVNDRGRKCDSFGLLFRDADHIEKYANEFWLWQRRRGGAA